MFPKQSDRTEKNVDTWFVNRTRFGSELYFILGIDTDKVTLMKTF